MPPHASLWVLASGVFNLVLALFHLAFWRIFRWPGSLVDSGGVNRGITQVLNLAITYLFLLAGLACLLYSADLATTALGRFWLLAMAIFWLARALIQPAFFGWRHALSRVLFGVFVVGAGLHGMAWLRASGL